MAVSDNHATFLSACDLTSAPASIETLPMSNDQDDVRPAQNHVVGAALDLLSIDDLSARIELLRDEILRIEATIMAKRAARDAAGCFFKT